MITLDMHTVAFNNIRDERERWQDERMDRWREERQIKMDTLFKPQPLPYLGSAPLTNTYNKFDDDDDGYKPFIPEPLPPLIKIGNRFDDDDDGYNPFKKY